jgi:hypothetical protein
MYLHPRLGVLIVRALALIPLLMMLAGCGASSSNTTGGPSSSASSNESPTVAASVTPTGSQNGSPLSPNATVMMKVDGLSIQSTTNRGIGCPPDFYSDTPNTLVLTEDRLDYDVATVRQMQDYINSLPRGPLYLNEGRPYSTPPDSLHEVLGSLIGNINGWNLQNRDFGCAGALTITNTGESVIQLTQVTTQLTAVPQKNNMHYRVINVCMPNTSHWGGAPACPSRPQGRATLYQADFNLKMGATNTEFQGQLHEYLGSPTTGQTGGVTLQPQDSLSLILNLRSSENLIYDVVPKLIVDIAGEQRQIVLPTSTLAFANSNQFSCYELQGTRFVELQQASTAGTDPQFDNTWCL